MDASPCSGRQRMILRPDSIGVFRESVARYAGSHPLWRPIPCLKAGARNPTPPTAARNASRVFLSSNLANGVLRSSSPPTRGGMSQNAEPFDEVLTVDSGLLVPGTGPFDQRGELGRAGFAFRGR